MEIIPKPKRRYIPFEKVILYFSLFILFFYIFYYFYLFFKEEGLKRKISQIEEDIRNLRTPEVIKMENTILSYQEKISNFSNLIKDFLFYSKFFPQLEEKTHKKIYFTNLSVNFEKSVISLSGESPSFYVLGQQIEIFKNNRNFTPELKSAGLGKEGKIDFSLEVIFDKNILK
jgi:hypothetical protein